MWRPPEFDKAKLVNWFFSTIPQPTLPELIDKTADTMLEALRNLGNKGFHHDWEDSGKVVKDNGITVFIPDEEE
jgi:hypothetical protein